MANIFVSPTGDDLNAGTLSSPLKTLKSALELAIDGDTISLNPGRYAAPRLDKSVTLISIDKHSPATVSSYVALNSDFWEKEESSIYWKADLSSIAHLGWAEFDAFSTSRNLKEARWPKFDNPHDLKREDCAISSDGHVDVADYDPDGTKGWYENANLATLPDLTGASIVLAAGQEWWKKAGRVLGHIKNRINISYNYSNTNHDKLEEDDPFFLWDLQALATESGEFFYDSVTKTLYLVSSGKPTEVFIRYAQNALEIKANNCKLKDLRVEGSVDVDSNVSGLVIDSCDLSRGFKDLSMRKSGALISLKGENNAVTNSTLRQANSAFIIVRGKNHQIVNNVMFESGSHGLQDGIQQWNPANILISKNTIRNTTSLAISITCRKSNIAENNCSFTGQFVTDVGCVNGWNAGDGEGTEISHNRIHSLSSYKKGHHYGSKGIRLDGGGSAMGCSNFRIHHNLVENVNGYSIVIWPIVEKQVRHGDAKIYVYQNSASSEISVANKSSNPTSYQGIHFEKNLAKNSGYAKHFVHKNNFFLDGAETQGSDYSGNPLVLNWRPLSNSPLSTLAPESVYSSDTKAIGWMDADEPVLWGGAEILSEQEITKLSADDDYVIVTVPPDLSLPQKFKIRINGKDYTADGHRLNSDRTLDTLFKVEDVGDLSVLGSLDGAGSFASLGTITKPAKADPVADRFPVAGRLTISFSDYPHDLSTFESVVKLDLSSLKDRNLVAVMQREPGDVASYWLEDLDTTDNLGCVYLHLRGEGLKLNSEGVLVINVVYDDPKIANYSSLSSFDKVYPELAKAFDESSKIVWFKAHSLKPLEENSPVLNWQSAEGYVVSQDEPTIAPKYSKGTFGPVVKFDNSYLVGADLGSQESVTLVAYSQAKSQQETPYSRLASFGINNSNDYSKGGLALLATVDSDGYVSDISTNNDVTLDSFTLGARYDNKKASFKGEVLEIAAILNYSSTREFWKQLRNMWALKYASNSAIIEKYLPYAAKKQAISPEQLSKVEAIAGSIAVLKTATTYRKLQKALGNLRNNKVKLLVKLNQKWEDLKKEKNRLLELEIMQLVNLDIEAAVYQSLKTNLQKILAKSTESVTKTYLNDLIKQVNLASFFGHFVPKFLFTTNCISWTKGKTFFEKVQYAIPAGEHTFSVFDTGEFYAIARKTRAKTAIVAIAADKPSLESEQLWWIIQVANGSITNIYNAQKP
ncbi:MAG: hypothetical protein F6J93_25720 [Oscillatoria sp. SIO1A7]|nr:hypothetical protein [Oscillatoria sp. SIO1A7]